MDAKPDGSQGGLRKSLRERPLRRASIAAMQRITEKTPDDLEQPSTSKKSDKRKPKRKIVKSVYDEYGHIRYNGKDVCDCMTETCPGCWFQCEVCGSTRCGVVCRVGRNFFYESITFDGKDVTIQNAYSAGK